MVDLMSLLSDALIGSFQMLMLNDFGKNMFPYRIKTCWKRILIYGVTALVILGVNHIESTFVNIMMVPVCYTIASIVIFQGSVWKKIILACCYYMLAIVPEFLFAVITGAYGVTGTENNFHSELEKLLSLLLMSTITFLLVKCFNQITRKKNYQTIENKLFTVLLTLPAATIIIFMCIYYSQISFTGVNRIMIPIGAALLLMTNICIFAVFDKLIEKSEEVKKMELNHYKAFSSQLPSNFQADIVIAVGVLNNSVNTDKCIYEINSVMKPGGILLIIETVEDVPDILITQSFMMTEPKDQRKATNTMFLNRKQWLEILEENGFCNSEEFPGYGEYLEVLGQKLFYCTKE